MKAHGNLCYFVAARTHTSNRRYTVAI